MKADIFDSTPKMTMTKDCKYFRINDKVYSLGAVDYTLVNTTYYTQGQFRSLQFLAVDNQMEVTIAKTDIDDRYSIFRRHSDVAGNVYFDKYSHESFALLDGEYAEIRSLGENKFLVHSDSYTAGTGSSPRAWFFKLSEKSGSTRSIRLLQKV